MEDGLKCQMNPLIEYCQTKRTC